MIFAGWMIYPAIPQAAPAGGAAVGTGSFKWEKEDVGERPTIKGGGGAGKGTDDEHAEAFDFEKESVGERPTLA